MTDRAHIVERQQGDCAIGIDRQSDRQPNASAESAEKTYGNLRKLSQ